MLLRFSENPAKVDLVSFPTLSAEKIPEGLFVKQYIEQEIKNMSEKTYGADSIKALKGLEAVRKRPGMYIGDTGPRGLHHLIWEVVDNSIDEVMAKHATGLSVHINPEGSITVIDDGRGIPVGWNKENNMNSLTLVLTVLHAGGKFDHDSYKVSGGLHGVGVSCVNALSEWLEAEVYRDGKIWFQRFERGNPVGDVEERGKTKMRGTKVTFMPDEEIFTETRVFKYETIATRLRELAFLNKGVKIEVEDMRPESKGDNKDQFFYEGGLQSYVEFLNENKTLVHKEVVHIEGNSDDENNFECEIAFQYNDGYNETCISFTNNINNPGGGTHLSGFRSALTRTLNAWGKKNKVIKDKDPAVTGDDCREGLSAIISVRVPDPQFEGQTKDKLGNREVEGFVQKMVNEELSTYLEENPKVARDIIRRAVDASIARNAARKARDQARRKNVLSGGGLPGKLADCISKDRESTELYMVEGDSAGGSAKMGRDSRTQAILPLKGKILNVEKARLDKMLGHSEVSAIITALGTGIGVEEFDIDKLRYGKVIIMCDADVDGSHIRTLLLTFFFRHMPKLIDNGNLFVACPPLYQVKRGKKVQYVLSDEEMNSTLTNLGIDGTVLEYRNNGSSSKIEGEKLNSLLSLIRKIDGLIRVLNHRGMTLTGALELRKQYGSFPKHKAILNGEEHFFVSGQALKDFIHEGEEKGIIDDTVEEDVTLSAGDITEKTLIETEFLFAEDLEKNINKISEMGFNIDHFLIPDDPAEKGKFVLMSNGQEEFFQTLHDILDGIQTLGERGLDIQRYKGLGEMDPAQLWETTMDPERRTLKKVTVDDAIKADQLFTLLMGEVVEPRRKFIEKYALDADLDI